MSKMVERVAQAIASKQLDEGDGLYDWFALTEEVSDEYRIMARAAIEAIRHPEDGMVPGYAHPGFAKPLWVDMIDEALKP